MVETRFPILNIVDAIWVNASPRGGPRTSYYAATRTNVIAASTDPVALDYWAAKNILLQAAQNGGYSDISSMDPDNTAPRAFGQWLRLSMQEISRAGYQTTVDEAHMNVYISQLQTATLTPTPTQGPTVPPRDMSWTYIVAIIGSAVLVAVTVGIIVTKKKRQGRKA